MKVPAVRHVLQNVERVIARTKVEQGILTLDIKIPCKDPVAYHFEFQVYEDGVVILNKLVKEK